MYRTNPNPETDPWVITGAMKVNRILTRAEQADLVRKAGREPQQIQEGDIVTDEAVNSINQQIASTPKFSLKGNGTVLNGKETDNKLSQKEKDDATERIDKRVAELNRLEKEQSLKSEHGNFADSHENGYLPPKTNPDGAQSVAPSLAKIDKKFPNKNFYLVNLANFITSMGKDADINASNFTKKLFEGIGMTPHGKEVQASEYFKYQTDDGGKTTIRLSDHSGNALSIIKKGGRADKGYSIVVRFDSSPKAKFKPNKYADVVEYVYDNPNFESLKDIARSVFNLIDTGEYIDLAGAVEVNVSPKENAEKFSLKDDKTLAGVHNISEEKLRKALKLGGFANPSVAVIDTKKAEHNGFGEISFIAPSVLVDKRTGNTAGTWTTDAYTQRYPSVERQMSEKGYEKFKEWVDGLDYNSAAKAEIKRQAKDVLEDNGTPVWELMYLKEKGVDIKGYDSQVDYRWEEILQNYSSAKEILDGMKSDPELREKVSKLVESDIASPIWKEISMNVRRQIYEETGKKVGPINPKVREKVREIFQRDYAPQLFKKDGTPRQADIKKVVEDMVQQYNDTKQYSFYKSKVKASTYVNRNGLYPDYIRWMEKKLDDFGTKNRIFRGYKNDGTRKYVPETLENVSKAMREEADGQTNGSEYTTFGSFIAKLADRVDSTEEMRANKDKLATSEDKSDFYEKWEEVYYDLAKFLYNDLPYGEERLHDIVVQPDPKKYAKKEYGITLTPTFMKKLDALKNAVRTELKSAYFETKFDRPVRLNEFVAAVVPNDLGTDVRKTLEESGLSLFEYDPKKEGDRKRAFDEATNSSDNIRFSLKQTNDRFNEELDKFTMENADKAVFDLGRPSAKLKAAGVADKPIRLNGSKLAKKIRKHGFEASELRDLPLAMENPIAVFDNLEREGNRSILTELKTANGNFLVTIDLGKGTEADFDVVSSVFGKNGKGVVYWINHGMMKYVDKEKALNYLHLSAPIAEASDKSELDSAAKILKDFENPSIPSENSSSEPKYSLRVDQYQHDLAQWKRDNNLPRDPDKEELLRHRVPRQDYFAKKRFGDKKIKSYFCTSI